MSGDLTDLIQREIARAMAQRSHHRAGTITSYDGKGRVKVKLMPDGTESGWMPIGRHQGGSDVDVVHGPTPGDQVVVGFLDGDIEAPFVSHFLHSDVDQHPAVASGETLIQHKKTGASIKIDKEGHITHTTPGNYSVQAKGAMTFEAKGAVTIKGSAIKHEKA